MSDYAQIVTASWTHTCLRMPGREGQPTPLIVQGVGGCIYCGDPGPKQQAKIDLHSVKVLKGERDDR